MPHPKNINQLTRLIAKHPVAFVGAVFFSMFWVTYFINLNQTENEAEIWKELYLKEKEDKDRFRLRLIESSGVIERQQEIIEQRDTILRQQTNEQAKEILEYK